MGRKTVQRAEHRMCMCGVLGLIPVLHMLEQSGALLPPSPFLPSSLLPSACPPPLRWKCGDGREG